jgi:hypothetical protein
MLPTPPFSRSMMKNEPTRVAEGCGKSENQETDRDEFFDRSFPKPVPILCACSARKKRKDTKSKSTPWDRGALARTVGRHNSFLTK